MANSFNVTDLVTREVLRVAHEKLSFIGTIDRQYDASFAANGAKHGDSLRVQNRTNTCAVKARESWMCRTGTSRPVRLPSPLKTVLI